MCILRSCLQSLGFTAGSSFFVMFHLIFNIGRSYLRMFARNFCGQICLRVPAVASFRKKCGEKCFSYGNGWPFLAFLMACGRWGHVFATSANARSCTKNMALSPSFTVRGGEYDTKMCNIRIDSAIGICERENFRRLVLTKRPKHEK